jgi:hypothetical protein
MYIYMQVQPQRKKPKQRNANAYSAGAEVGSVEMQGQKNKTPTFASFHTRVGALDWLAKGWQQRAKSWRGMDGRSAPVWLYMYLEYRLALPGILDGASQHFHLRGLAGWLADGGEDHPPSNSSLGNSFLHQSVNQSVSAFSTSGATSPLWCISAAPEPERPSSSSS